MPQFRAPKLKPDIMKYLYHLLTPLFGVLFSIASFAQPDRVEGELLLQIDINASAESIASDYRDAGLTSERLLSAPMNIYLFRFNPEANASELLKDLREDERVSLAQFNHVVRQRCSEINDPQYGTQWHHRNDGENGNTEDSDIDTDLAWGITTGGTTASGDTIVVCVIEGGNLNHPDLSPNAWRNNQEIPNNGIDDDNNGYVDDYLGWNVAGGDDSGVLQGGHGTQVMGMIGARGSNELGVVGANWDIKIMSVAGENLGNEASVVEAYTYPLTMRQRYMETEGDSGAFVVATNASWGIDFGDPTEVPIWTAFYDTLGVYGILNCGATANNNVDIDEVGDIPTAAPSDYMISVTATNSSDIRTFSAFGATTVDLGAPGEAVSTTAGSDEYTFTSGTSFASPLTAGVIGLLYSVPCQAFADFVRDNPQAGADLVRQALFDGVDPVPNLEGQTVTGGRLNAFNSLVLLLEECTDENICIPPVGFQAELEADTIYTLNWTSINELTPTVRFKPQSSEEWIVIEGIEGSSLILDTLSRCTTYDFEIGTACEEGGEVTYTSCLTISTLGCCVVPETLETDEIDETQTDAIWSTDFGIESYDLYYRLLGEEEWILYGNYADTNAVTIEGLTLCTEYELLVNPACSETLDGLITEFRTKGCGACLDNFYCPSFSNNSSEEFIEEVTIGSYNFQTGNNGGYAFFEDEEFILGLGEIYEVELVPGFTGQAWSEFFKIWIDLDQDGEFSEPEELVFSSEEGSSEPVSGQFTVPEDALEGPTRIRVAMKYVGGFGPDNVEACENYEWGETEDYCLTLTEVTSTDNNESLQTFGLFPNPTANEITLDFQPSGQSITGAYRFLVFDVTGKQLMSRPAYSGTNRFSLSEFESGVYLYRLEDPNGTVLKTGKLIKTD